VGLFVEVLHLLIVVAGVAGGAWSLFTLGNRPPRARFVTLQTGRRGSRAN